MHDRKDGRGKQDQQSRQSASQGGQSGTGSGKARTTDSRGIGASQGQDEGSRETGSRQRPSAGTADIERSEAGVETNGGNVDSLVDDPTGAFKERP